MKGNKNTEDAISRKRLRRKVLERWENEGGRICVDPGKTTQTGTSSKRGRRTQSLLADGNDSSPPSRKKAR